MQKSINKFYRDEYLCVELVSSVNFSFFILIRSIIPHCESVNTTNLKTNRKIIVSWKLKFTLPTPKGRIMIT